MRADSIGRGEDRPLRRRGAPPAARDRPGPRARLRVVRSTATPSAPGLQEADVAEVVDFADVARGDRGRPAPRRRRRAHGLGRPRRPGRRGGGRGARPARDRHRDGAPDDAQGRDAPRARRRRRAAAALRRGARPPRGPRRARDGRASRPCSSPPTRAASAASSGSSRADDLERTCTLRSPSRRRRRRSSRSLRGGLEMNGIVDRARRRAARAHALRPAAPARHRLRRRLDPRLPGTIYGDPLDGAERVAAHAVRALGLRDGIAFPQLIVAHGRRGRRRRGGGADPRRADGRPRPPRRRRRSRRGRAAAGARRGRAGRRRAARSSCSRSRSASSPRSRARCRPGRACASARSSGLALPGVVQAEIYLQVGETIRPVRLDGDRRGYVIAYARHELEALERAEAAAQLLDVGRWSRPDDAVAFDLAHYASCSTRAKRGAATASRPSSERRR